MENMSTEQNRAAAQSDALLALAEIVNGTLGGQGSYPHLSVERTEEILLLLLRAGHVCRAHNRIWKITIPPDLVPSVRGAGGHLTLAEWEADHAKAGSAP